MDFRRIPTVLTAQELTDKAFRRASRVTGSGRDRFQRVRSGEMSKVRTVQNVLSSTLEKYVKKFPSFDRLDPFYRDLADLIVDLDRVKQALGAVDWARKQVNRVGDEAVQRMKRAGSEDPIIQERKKAYGRIASVLKQVDGDLLALNKARNDLRSLPTIRLDVPTVVVAGYPNVGKSSFIAAASTGNPEVASYPFTTKGVSVGHVELERALDAAQLVDTPGLLDRPLEERNDIERQAVLALEHLADAILFLLDPSGTCGYPLEDQLHLLEETRGLFPGVPIHVVENKADLKATGERPAMSTATGEGVEDALEAVLALAAGDAAAEAVEGAGDVAWEHPGDQGL